MNQDIQFACAPVLLIGFNRPDFMVAQIDAVRPARPSRLYLAVDGPRDNRPEEAEQCRKVRDCEKLVDWPCEVRTLFRERNLGCKYGVSGAITWFFENETEGIVLEDDCRPTIDFLRFATEMLERYKNDERIGAVCGFNAFNLQDDKSVAYHFSHHMDVWGWASWRRVWMEYDVEMTRIRERIDDIIDMSKMTQYYKRMFKGFASAVANGLSTWDVQFQLLILAKGWLTIVPQRRLVANVGFADDRATHTSGYLYWGRHWSIMGEELEFPLVHPKEIVCDEAADYYHEKTFSSVFPRILTFIGSKLPRLRSCISVVGGVAERFMPFLFGRAIFRSRKGIQNT